MACRPHGAVAFTWASALLASATFLWTLASAEPSVDITYCASSNTGDAGTIADYNFMSDGYCSTWCFTNQTTKYALAVVQEKNCWCSDLVPAKSDQTDTDDCSTSCPGYPSDWCATEGLYAYMTNAAVKVSGTATAAGAATSTEASTHTTSASQPSSQITPSEAAETSTSVIVETETVQTTSESSATSSTSAIAVSTDASPTSSTGDSKESNTPSTSSIMVQTVTVGGTVTTVTSTPAPVPGPDNAGQADAGTKSTGLSSGAVAGVVVGIIGGMAAICLIGVWFWFRHRKQKREEAGAGDGPYDSSSKRGSSAGMMGTPGMDRFANGNDGRTMAETWESTSSGRRRSQLMPIDPRVDFNKNSLYPSGANISRETFNSLQDNQDYSRPVLRATNPDPDS